VAFHESNLPHRGSQLLREPLHARTPSRAGINARIGIQTRLSDLAKHHEVRYPTAKTDVEYLELKQILRELPHMKVKTFYSPEIIESAYVEPPQ
jgi:hypothetical protein